LNRHFRFLLAAKGIDAVGSQVTLVALPLTAVLVLHVTPFQMGLLAGTGALPGVLLGLIAGVFIDRLPKRRVMLTANICSAATMAAISVAAHEGMLSLPLLLPLAFLAASIATVDGIATLSFMPAIVPPENLPQANGRFGAVLSGAAVAGPAVAGVLIAALTAPGAITLDAASYLAAAFLILALPAIPVPPAADAPAETLAARLRAGFDFSFAGGTLKLFVGFAAALNLCGGGISALEALFIVRQLHVPPAWFGGALACGGIGAVAGALISGHASKRLNVNLLMAIAAFVSLFTGGFICSLHGARLGVAAGFGAAQLIGGIGNGVLGAAVMTFLQQTTPPHMMARVIGALTTLIGASVPVGALAGGAVASLIGVRYALIAETAGFALILAIVVTVSGQKLFEPVSSPSPPGTPPHWPDAAENP